MIAKSDIEEIYRLVCGDVAVSQGSDNHAIDAAREQYRHSRPAAFYHLLLLRQRM